MLITYYEYQCLCFLLHFFSAKSTKRFISCGLYQFILSGRRVLDKPIVTLLRSHGLHYQNYFCLVKILFERNHILYENSNSELQNSCTKCNRKKLMSTKTQPCTTSFRLLLGKQTPSKTYILFLFTHYLYRKYIFFKYVCIGLVKSTFVRK